MVKIKLIHSNTSYKLKIITMGRHVAITPMRSNQFVNLSSRAKPYGVPNGSNPHNYGAP